MHDRFFNYLLSTLSFNHYDDADEGQPCTASFFVHTPFDLYVKWQNKRFTCIHRHSFDRRFITSSLAGGRGRKVQLLEGRSQRQ
jgi:hypothetical protein